MKHDCPDREAMFRFVDGSLEQEATRMLERHLDGCEACRREITAVRRLIGLLRSAGSASDRPVSGTCPGGETVAAYADGSLAAGQALEVEEHLAGCAACCSELADLWALSGSPDMNVSDTAVERVLARLEREGRTAVVRWKDRAVELVRDFADSVSRVAAPEDPEPAFAAAARAASDRIALKWTGEGLEVRAVIEAAAAGANLTGNVSSDVVDSAALSVSMSSRVGMLGPESLDAGGRFGPWNLSGGSNILRLTGGPLASGQPLELVIEVAEESGTE